MVFLVTVSITSGVRIFCLLSKRVLSFRCDPALARYLDDFGLAGVCFRLLKSRINFRIDPLVLTWHTVSCGDLRGTFFATWLVLCCTVRSYSRMFLVALCALVLRTSCTDLLWRFYAL